MTTKKQQRRYDRRVDVSRVAQPPQMVRYAMEVDWDEISRLIRRARHQKGGKAVQGPVTVWVHPEDRLP
jgi:hypothetical protein